MASGLWTAWLMFTVATQGIFWLIIVVSWIGDR